MKNWWRWFGLLAAWWMTIFLVQRLLFLAFAYRSLSDIPWSDILLSNWKAIPMDISATGYLLLLSWLASIPLFFTRNRWAQRLMTLPSLVLLGLAAVINSADIGLFEAWGSRVDRKAIGYLAYPREALAGLQVSWILILFALVALQVFLFARTVPRATPRPEYHDGPIGPRLATLLLAPLLCLLAARGGPQDLPINKSWAYFSRYSVLNLAALNGVWNALEIVVEPAQVEANPYVTMPAEQARHIFLEQHPTEARPSTRILKNTRPNILLILLESWTADIIEPLGGDSGVAPEFTRLAQDGLLFTRFYSTGFRTEQGLCALISAFPSQPKTTIIRNFGKFDRLPSLVRSLGGAGYSSTYWYAGNVEFANTRAYLEAMGFDRVEDEHAFPIVHRTDWGAFDEELFQHHLSKAGMEPRPFFHVVMTSTSHEPFDAPVNEGFPGKAQPQMYRNTVHYTDRQLGAFIDGARAQDWYANTLVVIVADHGHYLPRFREQYSAARHRIPFLLTGGALKDSLRGTIDSTYASHVDLAATLLGQMGIAHDPFSWSRDLFDPGLPHSAFWTFNDGFGIADSAQTLVFDEVGERVIELSDSSRQNDRERLLTVGKAQLQILLDEYIGFDQ